VRADFDALFAVDALLRVLDDDVSVPQKADSVDDPFGADFYASPARRAKSRIDPKILTPHLLQSIYYISHFLTLLLKNLIPRQRLYRV
jgi:hypothetical protein